ncbi:Ribosomal protein S23/S25 mitochondrial [Trinorchestia longiramus]|nr:Ribosomal protein S23/S25 mitochondrial [Trinorchestia longiramus]
MAGSRRFKIGDIFTRTTGLLQSGVVKPEDKPIWYDVYKAFPPLEPPKYDRPIPYFTIKPIFYPEDVIRAKYYRKYGSRDTLNLNEAVPSRRVGFCQAFVEAYQQLEKEKPDLAEEELMLKTERALENKGIYLDFTRRPVQQPNEGAEDGEGETPVPVGDLEVPDTLMKSFHLASIFSHQAGRKQSLDHAANEDDLTPEEQEILKKSVEEMNKLGPIMDDGITEELDFDDEYEELRLTKEKTNKDGPGDDGKRS